MNSIMLTNFDLKTSSRKSALAIVLVFLAILLLVGCSGKSSSENPTQISFGVFGSEDECKAYQEIVAAFAEKHPEIEVQIQYIPEDDEYRQRLATQFSGGQPPDALLFAARALTVDVNGDGTTDRYGAGIAPRLIRMAPFIWQNGGELVDNRDEPTQLTLDSPATKEAFQWFVDLQAREHVVPDAVAEAASPSKTRFLNGTLGMFFNSRRGVPTYRTIESFAWDVAPLPIGKQRASILHSDGFCMSSASEHKDEAWAFIEFVNSVEGQTALSKTGRIVPSLIAVAESPAFLDASKSPANNRAYIDTAATIYPIPVVPGWAAVESLANREVERAFYGQAAVDEAVQTADEITKEYFDKDATFSIEGGDEE